MRKGNLVTPSKDLLQSSRNLTATKGMSEMGGLMGGDAAGVPVKQIENVSVGEPKLTSPMDDRLQPELGAASKAGAKIGKANLNSPSTDMRKGYGK